MSVKENKKIWSNAPEDGRRMGHIFVMYKGFGWIIFFKRIGFELLIRLDLK